MPELHFKGKEFVYNHHLSVPYRPLIPHANKSIGDGDLTGNIIVNGDNLHALKALLPLYAGKVDCIYIDPPYNTGEQTWEYNDNVNSPIMQQWLKENPVNSEDMLRHDKWACMMYPRLVLLKELLRDEGIIFISINDIEAATLRQIMDDIFTEQLFICQLVWKSRQNKDNRNTSGVSVDHEYVFVYGKKVRGDDRREYLYSNTDNDPRGPWTSGNMVGLATKDERPNLHYDLINPETGLNYGCPPQGWRYEPDTMQRLIADRRILWPSSPDGRPREKVFLNELDGTTNISSLIGSDIYTRNGTEEVERIFGRRVFKFPKPSLLIQELIRQGCPPNGIVLDSFAGSATTAHAVLALNNKDEGDRKFLLVECEDYANSITAERVRRVIGGYSFQGTQKEELLKEKITFTSIKKAGQLLHEIEGIENLEKRRFNRISKSVKDGVLTVVGEKDVEERTDGLGGSFTFCTLGDPLDLDKILTGENLPDYKSIGAWLFHTATGEALDPAKVKEKTWFLGESAGFFVWLVYKQDLNFLKSPNAALTITLAEKIAASKHGKKHIVFAPAKFVPNKILLLLGVEYAPLPFALYRVERG